MPDADKGNARWRRYWERQSASFDKKMARADKLFGDSREAAGFDIELRERFKLGITERLAARKPAAN